eukprot:9448225-Pyramimonas_sp.AAC.1
MESGTVPALRVLCLEVGARRCRLQRCDPRARDRRPVTAGTVAAQRDSRGEIGARRHQIQRWQ